MSQELCDMTGTKVLVDTKIGFYPGILEKVDMDNTFRILTGKCYIYFTYKEVFEDGYIIVTFKKDKKDD